ncbi:aliphatic sulfonate ABC transporter permease SsuC [Brasilonema bromeliae]|uniref:Aliphatic sulfonate ABC transporter permease SsuC n=1 Tax=Brasilonema bromeliae SPC951 TaxID=385972 RepID=A0ABX1P4M2_9CYAN|nr:aliphatic sulfonate ABC transporter permease SsuC [Brasilonema bromeliae]NMG19296.1 aliphatic sulfonate ABC transporter permease SsuC [Brasilonema bromeliae SPC951]
MKIQFLKRYFNQLAPWCVPLLLVVIWQLLVQFGFVSERVLPTPTNVLLAGIRLAKSGELFFHLGISAQRAVLGFLIGGSIAFVLGLLNGIIPIAEKLLDTPIQMLRNIPHLAMIPLVILWFGVGEEGRIFLVAIGVSFPIYINTFHGVRTVDPNLIEMGKVYGLKPWSLFWEIIFPGALPSILIGVRYALGVMWLTLIVAETISYDSGIGYMAMNAREFMQTDVVVLSILLYALLGKLADVFAKFLENKLLSWHPSYQNL